MPKSKHLFQIKKTNASARAVEKAKTYDDFDWEKLIRTNELENLYISQLDLYLMANFNLSKKDCEKKGFTKASKIENIKKHFYSSVNQRRKHAPHREIHVALPQTGQIKEAHAVLQVPPWSSRVTMPHQGQVNRPIDIFLTIFYVLMKTRNKFFLYLLRSPELYAITLIKICEMFNDGNFAEDVSWPI